MDDLVVVGQWTRSESFRANRSGQNWWPEVAVAAGSLALALLNHDHLAWALEAVVAVGIIVAMSFWILPARIWSQGIGIQESYHSTINDDGVRVTSESLELFVDWNRFHRSREIAEFSFLRPKRSLYSTPVRKSTFTSPQDQADFRSLLRAHTVTTLERNALLDSGNENTNLPL